MKWDKIVDESRPRVRLVDIALVFTYETNLVDEDGSDFGGGPVQCPTTWTLTEDEQEQLESLFPELIKEAEEDALLDYEGSLEDLKEKHEAYLEKWRDIVARRKATMAAKKG